MCIPYMFLYVPCHVFRVVICSYMRIITYSLLWYIPICSSLHIPCCHMFLVVISICSVWSFVSPICSVYIPCRDVYPLYVPICASFHVPPCDMFLINREHVLMMIRKISQATCNEALWYVPFIIIRTCSLLSRASACSLYSCVPLLWYVPRSVLLRICSLLWFVSSFGGGTCHTAEKIFSPNGACVCVYWHSCNRFWRETVHTAKKFCRPKRRTCVYEHLCHFFFLGQFVPPKNDVARRGM